MRPEYEEAVCPRCGKAMLGLRVEGFGRGFVAQLECKTTGCGMHLSFWAPQNQDDLGVSRAIKGVFKIFEKECEANAKALAVCRSNHIVRDVRVDL